MLERKRCQNPHLGAKGAGKRFSRIPCAPKGRSGGAGGCLGDSELREGLGMEQKRCRSGCPPTGTKIFQGFGVAEGGRRWQWHLGDALSDLGWEYFFSSHPLRSPSRAGGKAAKAAHAKMWFSLFPFLRSFGKSPSEALLHGKPLGNLKKNKEKKRS